MQSTPLLQIPKSQSVKSADDSLTSRGDLEGEIVDCLSTFLIIPSERIVLLLTYFLGPLFFFLVIDILFKTISVSTSHQKQSLLSLVQKIIAHPPNPHLPAQLLVFICQAIDSILPFSNDSNLRVQKQQIDTFLQAPEKQLELGCQLPTLHQEMKTQNVVIGVATAKLIDDQGKSSDGSNPLVN